MTGRHLPSGADRLFDGSDAVPTQAGMRPLKCLTFPAILSTAVVEVVLT